MGTMLILFGALIALFGYIKVVVAAFQESAGWGIFSIFPILNLVFILTHWQEGKNGFFLMFLGGFLKGVGRAMGGGYV